MLMRGKRIKAQGRFRTRTIVASLRQKQALFGCLEQKGGINNGGSRLNNYAKKDKEILIEKSIPKDAIISVNF